jgi:hypothetical protein
MISFSLGIQKSGIINVVFYFSSIKKILNMFMLRIFCLKLKIRKVIILTLQNYHQFYNHYGKFLFGILLFQSWHQLVSNLAKYFC